jgi:hypothetical protein
MSVLDKTIYEVVSKWLMMWQENLN